MKQNSSGSRRFWNPRCFWIINLALLLLYGWTLNEESDLTVQVEDGRCTAVSGSRHSSIPCPGLSGGYIGLYLSGATANTPVDFNLSGWLAPRSAWRQPRVSALTEPGIWHEIQLQTTPDNWERVAGEWQPRQETAVVTWPAVPDNDYIFAASLRHPEEEAGILLLGPDGETGWILEVSPLSRRIAWWHWQDGQPGAPIAGIPFQEPALAQSRSWLRRILQAQQMALLLLLGGRLARRAVLYWPQRWRRRRILSPGPAKVLSSQPRPELVAMLVLMVTLLIAGRVLDRLPHVQDSITYLFQAQTLARGRLWAPAPPLPAAFEQEFLLVRDGRWFGKYPPGFPLLLALGVLLNQPWLVNPLLAALTIPTLYILGRSLYGPKHGRLVILLALFSPFFLLMSGSMMAHPAELFWITLFMASWLRALKNPWRRRWPAAAGMALGAALLTREYTAVVGVSFVVLTSLARIRDGQMVGWRPLWHCVRWLLAAMLPLILLLLAYRWALTGSPLIDPRLLYWEFDRPGFGQDVGQAFNAFTLTEEDSGELVREWYLDPTQPLIGHTLARGLYNGEQNWRSLEIHLFGWPAVFTLAFAWLVLLARRPNGIDLALLGTAGSLIGAYIFYWSSGIVYGPRYYYAVLPIFLLLTARGIRAAAAWIGGQTGQVVVAGLASALILVNLLSYLPDTLDAYRDYNFVSAGPTTLVAKQVPGKAIIFVEAGSDWWDYGTFFAQNTPWLDEDIIYARDQGAALNRRLLDAYPHYQAYQWRDDMLLGPVTYP